MTRPSPTTTPARLVFEAETSFAASNTVVATTSDPAASKGQWHALKATAVDDWVEYAVTAPAGRYRVSTLVKAHAERGQAQLLVNGSQLGPVFDEYLAPADGSYQYREVAHGEADLSGSVVLRYGVTGRNAASTAYGLATDQLILTPGVVTIDQDGVAHAGARGTAVLRVTSQIESTATATVAVTVQDARR